MLQDSNGKRADLHGNGLQRGSAVWQIEGLSGTTDTFPEVSTLCHWPAKWNPYQYNGKEFFADIGFDLMPYGARYYDPAVGRFTGGDPRVEKYTAWSPYNYVLGNPIINIDPQGDTVKISHQGNNYVYNNGSLSLNGEEYTGKVRGYLKRAVKALKKISSTETGAAMLNELVASEHNVVIKYKRGAANFVPGFERFGKPDLMNNAQGLRVEETGKKVVEFFDFTEVGSGGTVYWDPSVRPDGGKPKMVLAHELYHGLDATKGMLDSRFIDINGGKAMIQEIRAVHNTNLIRGQLGKRYRKNYSGGPSLLDAKGNPINVSPPYGF